MWNFFIIGFSVAVAAGDIAWGKIPTFLTTIGILAGLGFHTIYGGLGSAAFAAFIGFSLGLTLFHIGAIGGGDVKLIAALGALLGLSRWLIAMKYAILCAGLIALAQILRSGRLRESLGNMGELLRWFSSMGYKPHPVITVANSSALRSPFALAAACGVFAAVLLP